MVESISWLDRAVCVAAVCACLAVPVSAGLVNGGFEEGDLSGWAVSARDVARYGIGGDASPPLPIEGSYFAILASDVAPWTELSQEVAMGIGDEIAGYAWYDRYIPTGAEAYVRVYDSSDALIATPWLKTTEGSSAWESWVFTAGSADTYKLVLGIREPTQETFHTQAYFDGNVYVDNPDPETPTVPVPGAGLLSMVGLGIMGWMKRRLA